MRQLAGADIDLRFELAAGLPHVECDAEEIVQVLSTFIVTVRGALPLGGVDPRPHAAAARATAAAAATRRSC